MDKYFESPCKKRRVDWVWATKNLWFISL